MRANFYGKQRDVGDYPNCSQGYDKLRQVPVQRGRDANTSTCDNDAYLQCKGAPAVPRLPGPLRARERRALQLETGHLVHRLATSRTLTDLAMATTQYSKWDFFNVYLDLTEKGLGMSIRGGNDSPDIHGNINIYVSRILAGGAVHQDGRLNIGDILLDVNGISLENVSHKDAVNNIMKASPYLHFYVKRPKTSTDIYEQIDEEETEDEPLICQAENEQTDNYNLTHFNNEESCIKVELVRDESGGFGFSLSGGLDNQMSPNDTRIYVSKLVQNGPAHRNGLIQVGDQIMAINNTDLERVPYNWALNLIRSSPALSIFTIRKAVVWD